MEKILKLKKICLETLKTVLILQSLKKLQSLSSSRILADPDIDCLMSNLSYASWIIVVGLLCVMDKSGCVVGLLLNCCRYQCRCLPRALFPGINQVRDRCSNFSLLST